jgi:FKBP-type peptidyl-prolyl cis-trans isomerase SlpA
MQQWVPRKLLDTLGDPDEQYHVGEVVEFATPDGHGHLRWRCGAAWAARATARALLIDFNHPLAGQPVSFEAYVIGVL